jgi:hypothetical protein
MIESGAIKPKANRNGMFARLAVRLKIADIVNIENGHSQQAAGRCRK